jgi:hypothetical protein
MGHLRARLKAVAEKLVPDQLQLARAQRRYKANRKRAFKAHNQQVTAQKAADRLRAQGHPRRAEQKDREALRQGHVASKNHARAQFWLGRIKALTQRVEGLETTQHRLEAKLKELKHVTIKGNKASGGSRRDRLKAVALASAAACASGKRPNFYSQSGSWDVDHCITGERYGERSDCSSWFTSVYRSCGLADPNGERFTAGYTGTLVANGKQIDHPEVGCAVIYGPGAGHHVELYVGPGNRTIGHGSAPVDPGVIDLFGDRDFRFFRYL